MKSTRKNSSLAKKIAEIKFLINSCGKKGISRNYLREAFGLNDQTLSYVVEKVLIPAGYVFNSTQTTESNEDIQIFSNTLNINCYSFDCWEDVVEDAAGQSLLETLASAQSEGLTYGELKVRESCTVHMIDKLVNIGVVVKDWAMPLQSSSRTNGTCILIHLANFVDEFDPTAAGFVYHPTGSIRSAVVQFIHTLLTFNDVPVLPCENAASCLHIRKRQMQYLRNHVSAMRKQGMLFPIDFEVKRTAAITKMGRIGSVRLMWCISLTQGENQKLITRYENLPFYEQIDLYLRHKGGVTSTDIRVRGGVSRKRAFKVSQEFINTGKYPKLKQLENKTLQYTILPKPGGCRTSTGFMKVAIESDYEPVALLNEDKKPLLEVEQSSGTEIKRKKKVLQISSTNVSESFSLQTESFFVDFLNKTSLGVALLTEAMQDLNNFHRKEYGIALNQESLSQMEESLLLGEKVQRLSLSLTGEETSKSNSRKTVDLIVLTTIPDPELRGRQFLQGYFDSKSSQKAEGNSRRTKTNSKTATETEKVDFINTTRGGIIEGEDARVMSKSSRREAEVQSKVIEEMNVGVGSEVFSVLLPPGSETNETISTTTTDLWTTREDVELLSQFFFNLVVRKARNGLPSHLKPNIRHAKTRKGSKWMFIAHPRYSSLDFLWKDIELKWLRSFYIINATVKVSRQTLSSCRRRIHRHLKDLSSIHQLMTVVLQHRVMLRSSLGSFELDMYNLLLSKEFVPDKSLADCRSQIMKKLSCSYRSFRPSDVIESSDGSLAMNSLRLVLKELYLHGIIRSTSNDVLREGEPSISFSFSYQKAITERWLGVIYYQTLFEERFAQLRTFYFFTFENEGVLHFHRFSDNLITRYGEGSHETSSVSVDFAIDSLLVVSVNRDPSYCTFSTHEQSQVPLETIDQCRVSLQYSSNHLDSMREKAEAVVEDRAAKKTKESEEFDGTLIYQGHILAFLSEFPGSSLQQVHAMVNVLSLEEVADLLEAMVRRNMVNKFDQLDSIQLLDPFESEFFWQTKSSASKCDSQFYEVAV